MTEFIEKLSEMVKNNKDDIIINIKGWRGINHSYAIVLENYLKPLMNIDGFCKFYFTDMPFYNNKWQKTHKSLFDDLPEMPSNVTATFTLKFYAPYDLTNEPNSLYTIVFITCEYQVLFQFNTINCPSNTYILTPSEYSKKGLIRTGFDTNKIFVIPHGYDINRITDSKNDLRKQYNIPLSSYVYLHIGAMTPNKNVELIVKSFVKLCETHSNIFLVLKSSVLYDTNIDDIIDSNNRIIHITKDMSRYELDSLYKLSDCYLSPYTAEGFNIPVLEALSNNSQVICTNNGPTNEFAHFAHFIDSELCVLDDYVLINESQIHRIILKPNEEHFLKLMQNVIYCPITINTRYYSEQYSLNNSTNNLLITLNKILTNVTDVVLANVINITQYTENLLLNSVSINPKNTYAGDLLAKYYYNNNKIAEAVSVYNNCFNNNPDNDDIKNNLITVYNSLLSKTDDIASKKKILMDIITLDPNNINLYNTLAEIYNTEGNMDMAIMYYKVSISLKDNVVSQCNLSIIYYGLGNYNLACIHVLNAEALDSTNEYVLCHAGLVYKKLKKYKTAIKYYKKALDNCKNELYKIKVRTSLNGIYLDLGDYNEYYDFSTIDELSMVYPKNISKTMVLFESVILSHDYTCYMNNPKELTYEDRLRINNIYNINPMPYIKYNNNKIKIGYVSADFVGSPIATFMYNILYYHDKSTFEIYCFMNNARSDEITKILQTINGIKWIDINKLSDHYIANVIREYQIDILIDLSGLTNGNRLGVFAYKPSPVQITYLGFPNTTGLHTIDYRLTDYISDPITTTQKFSEKLLYIPDCFLSYHNFLDIKELPINYNTKPCIVFGTLNKLAKINNNVLKLWSNILSRVPNSKFLIKIDSEYVLNRLLTQLSITRDRIILVHPDQQLINFFKIYNSIDICLDTFPYSGTTTTCDTLYMSVPLITLYKENIHSHNVSASILTNIGLSELIAYSEQEYIDIAINLANDGNRLFEYHHNIRDKFIKTMMNGADFIHKYESVVKSIV